VNLYEGLANGTRLRLKSISDSRKVIKVEIMTGPKAKKDIETGEHIFSIAERTFPLFQIPNTNENDPVIRMIRKQFPVRLTYCMSINKAQGQTLKRVGLYLPNPVFSHGQLYVAMSRVSRPENIVVYIQSYEETHGEYRGSFYTKNVVYDQLLKDEINIFKSSDKFVSPNPYGEDDSDDQYTYNNNGDYHNDFEIS
jgi:ATP-dependent DNA helicase PIF1